MFLGLLAGIVGIVGYIPYVRDILKGTTRPDRASWLIWLLEYAALFVAQLRAGGRESLWLIGLQLLGVVCICILSYSHGVGGFDRYNKLILVTVCAVLAAWYFTSSDSLTILLLLTVEMSGVVLTARKVYMQPGSETLTMWVLVAVAGAIGIAAVGIDAAIILYVYPVALIIMGLGVVLASWAGNRRQSAASLVLVKE
jgi:hypothetical protein